MGACSIGGLEAECGVAVPAVEGPRCQARNKESYDFSRVECQYGFPVIMKERYQMLLANDIDNGADDEDYIFIASRCRKHIESLD